MTTPDLDEAVAGAARELLLTRYPAAQFDATRTVSTAGFLCSPGAPGSAKARVCHRTRFPGVLSGLTIADAAAEEYVLVSAYADLFRARGWSVRERQGRPALLVSTPACPECSGPTLPLSVEAGEIWGCPACGRRTCGTVDENDDFDLPSYTETGPDGAVVVYHGHGEVDIEATAEWASQDGPHDEDDDEEDEDGDPHAGCFEPHRTADGYADCDGREL